MAKKLIHTRNRAAKKTTVKLEASSPVSKSTVARSKAPTKKASARWDDASSRQAIRLSFLIHDVSRMRRAAYDQFMKPLGITRAQWWVLAHLSRQDGMMQTQLADVLEVGKASLGDVIENLEERGWVERRPDSSDKRAKRVFLARPAQALIERMTQMEDEFNRQILNDITASERTELTRSLLKIKEAITRFNPGANSAGDEG